MPLTTSQKKNPFLSADLKDVFKIFLEKAEYTTINEKIFECAL